MRKLMWFSAGFCGACILNAYFYRVIPLWLAVCIGTCSLAGFFLFHSHKAAKIVTLLVFSFSVGICWFCLYDSVHLMDARALDGKTQNVQIELTDFSRANSYGCTAEGKITVNGKDYQLVAYLDEEKQLMPGTVIEGTFRFRFTSEGGLEEATYHRGEGIYLLAYQQGDLVLSEEKEVSLFRYPAVLRRMITQRIDELFPEDAAAFAKALLVGDRSGIDYEMNTAFKVSGISHIIAVSGLHVTILFTLLHTVFLKRRVLSTLVGIPVLILFAAVAGFSPSVTRACIMQCLMLLATLLNREYDPPTALGAAALVMVVVNPMVVISISFQLSVGCMIGIFLFSHRIHGWLLDDKRLGSAKGKSVIARLKRWFAGSISISLSASVITIPLVAIYFGTVSLVSLVTNLLVVWLVSYIFYGIIFCILLSLVFMQLSAVAAAVVTYLIYFVLVTAKMISKLPFAAVYTQSQYIVIWLVFTYLMLAVFLCIKKKPVLLMFCCTAITLCASLVAAWVEPLVDECRVTVLDVGQGQCVLLQSEGRSFLVDCGGDSSTKSADLAAETLLSQGISRLDGIIVTHFDADHAGGIPYLLTRVPADTVFLPDILDENAVGLEIESHSSSKPVYVKEDLLLTFGQSKLTLYAPDSRNMGNESSMCVLFQTENCDILITGDRGTLGEMLLLHKAQLPKLEVLIAGHHGSASSTGDKLLMQTMPEYVLISVGRNNRYGHPAESLLERLQKYDAKIYRTDQNGTIIFRR